jgi:hypothetical protein
MSGGGKILREVIPQMTTPFRAFGDMVATYHKLPISGLVPNPRFEEVKLVRAEAVRNTRVKGTSPGGISYGQTVYCAPRHTPSGPLVLGQNIPGKHTPAPKLEYTPLVVPVKKVRAVLKKNTTTVGNSPGGTRYGMPMMSG